MKRLRNAIVTWTLAAVLCLPVLAAGVPRAVMNAKDGVVRIFCYTASGEVYSGTGFSISNGRDGAWIVTNCHVIEGCDRYELYYDGAGPAALSVAAKSETQDLCVLRTENQIKGLQALSLYKGKIESGQAVYTMGYPGSADILAQKTAITKEEMTVTNGIISAIQSSYLIGYGQQPVKLLQTNADINHGNSGGPMLNEDGQVIGINTVGLNDYNIGGTNGAIHVQELQSFLDVQGISYKTEKGMGGLWLLLALSGVLAAVILLVWKRVKNKVSEKQEIPQPQLPANAVAFPIGGLPNVEVPCLIETVQEKPIKTDQEVREEPDSREGTSKEVKKRRCNWHSLRIGIIVALMTLMVAGGGGGFLWYSQNTYQAIQDAVEQQEYARALELYQKAPWLEKRGDTRQKEYCKAMVAAWEHQFDKAIEQLQRLGDYEGSQQAIENLKLYKKAESAAGVLQKAAMYQKLGGFLDCPQQQEKLYPALYDIALKQLASGEIDATENVLQYLPEEYEKVAEYKSLLQQRENFMNTRRDNPKCSEDLLALLRRGESLGVNMKPTVAWYIDNYLEGEWRSRQGKYFTYNAQKLRFSTNIFFVGDMELDFLQNGFYLNGRRIVELDYINADTLTMKYQGQRYMLYRQ